MAPRQLDHSAVGIINGEGTGDLPRFSTNRLALPVKQSAFVAISALFMENPAPFTANCGR